MIPASIFSLWGVLIVFIVCGTASTIAAEYFAAKRKDATNPSPEQDPNDFGAGLD